MTVNPTYKTLDASLRAAGLRLAQWGQLAASLIAAIAFGYYLSPFSAGTTIAISGFFAGLPVALSYAAMGLEFSAGTFISAAVRWARRPKRYLPGPGRAACGYVVEADPQPDQWREAVAAPTTSVLESLWDL